MNPPLLPPDHPDAPKYWAYETSGRLVPVIQAYLTGETLDEAGIGVMRDYLRQWVNSPVWSSGSSIEGRQALESLRARVAAIASREDIEQAIEAAEALGMDPL